MCGNGWRNNPATAVAVIETLRKAWAGRFAEMTQGKGSVANVPASLEVTVDSPAAGATITGPDVTVSGTIINSSGAETGITVNGMPATVSGSRFIVNHVPLQAGSNTLTVTATDANGLMATTTRTVISQAGHYIRINSNIDSGTAPLNISLRLDGSFSIASPQVSGSGPAPVTLTSGTSATEYTATLTAEGTYTFTASVVGPDGQTYNDSVTVTVIPRYQLETLLKGKWEALIENLFSGNTTSALNVLHSKVKSQYQAMFSALGGQLPSIISSQQEFNFISANNKRVKYELVTNESSSLYSYEVLFLKEGNGLWLLYEF